MQSSIPFSEYVYAIDISHHNKIQDWKEVVKYEFANRRLGGVFMKATEGSSFTSTTYYDYSAICSEYSDQITIKGSYHFYRTSHDGATQANHMTEVLNEDNNFNKQENFYVIDVEKNDDKISQEEFAKEILDFIDVMGDNGFTKPMVYTRTNFWNENIGYEGEDIWSNAKLWLSRYGKNTGQIPEEQKYFTELPYGASTVSLWQFTDKGEVDGITGEVDLNLIGDDLC